MAYYLRSREYGIDSSFKANPVGIDYLVRFELKKKDHTSKMPDKWVFKRRMPQGLYGYTYLGGNQQWLNELLDQTQYLKFEVDIHELIHTDDEQETRYISKEMIKEEDREDIIKRILKGMKYVCLN